MLVMESKALEDMIPTKAYKHHEKRNQISCKISKVFIKKFFRTKRRKLN